LGVMVRGYARSLAVALNYRALMLLIMAATVVITGMFYARTPKGYFPQDDTGLIWGGTQASTEVSFQAMYDLQQRADGWALLVRDKFHDRLVYLRADVAEALNLYLDSQTRVVADTDGTPLFTCVGNRAIGRGITPRGLRFTVDGYLTRT